MNYIRNNGNYIHNDNRGQNKVRKTQNNDKRFIHVLFCLCSFWL